MLKDKILDLLNRSDFMTLSTSVAGNSSAANVYFANDGLDIYFFTFNPSRKAVQISINPKVQCVIRPDGEDGIKELQIDAYASKVTDKDEVEKAKKAILNVTEAFSEYMHDDFLIANDVIGYYKIQPTTIKYVDFYAEKQFEWMEVPENRIGIFKEIKNNILNTLKYWITVIRAPFLTATIAPIMLGSAIAYEQQFGEFNWSIFWMVMLGAVCAQIGTNNINDYFDHKSRNDEINKLSSPFNGGSRAIQSGLITPTNMLLLSIFFFSMTILIGLSLNNQFYNGSMDSPLMRLGYLGIFLGVMYTGFFKLAYNGLGDLAVFIGFGPLMVYGAALMQDKAIEAHSVDPVITLIYSVPVGIFIALVLFINCFQDYNADKAANKNSWVVKLAGHGEKADYRKPFSVWKRLMIISFLLIVGASVYANNYFTLIALIPLLIFNFASKKGSDWLVEWEKEDANLQQLPYELLIVNVSTIGIHFLTGILLTIGVLLSVWI